MKQQSFATISAEEIIDLCKKKEVYLKEKAKAEHEEATQIIYEQENYSYFFGLFQHVMTMEEASEEAKCGLWGILTNYYEERRREVQQIKKLAQLAVQKSGDFYLSVGDYNKIR